LLLLGEDTESHQLSTCGGAIRYFTLAIDMNTIGIIIVILKRDGHCLGGSGITLGESMMDCVCGANLWLA
jgi:hypothetical protein